MRAGWKAIPIVAVSSILGLLTFQYELLLPLLTGFFGLPTLALASGEVPAQPAVFNPVLRWPAILRLAFLGSFVSSFFSTLPAVSSSIAASAARLFGRLKPAEFMALLGSINCSYMMFSFFTLFLLGKARSGSAAFVSQFAEANLPFVFGIALFSGVLAVAVCMLLGRKAVSIYHRIRPARMRIIASGLLVAINFLLAGFFGLLVLATATAIGISAQLMRVERTACMAGLIVPAIAALL
jgi:putative membrane protein